MWTEAATMFESLGAGGASWPLLAILAGILLGLFGARHDPTYRVLRRVADAIENAGSGLAYVMLPLILAFGHHPGRALRREAGPLATTSP